EPGAPHDRARPVGHPRPPPPYPHARLRARPRGHRELLAVPPNGDARGHQPGLHPHRAREGAPRAYGHRQPRLPQRTHPCCHRPRRHPRRSAAGLWSDAWSRLRRARVTMAALAVIVLLILVSLAAPIFEELVFRYKFDQQDLLHAYNPPTLDPIYYIFGADEIGRSQAV